MKWPHAGRPRVRVAPRAVDSDGPDAGFLASQYGLTPDEWQAAILEDWLGRRRDGKWSAATCGLAVPRQNGKNALIEVRELYGMAILGERFLHTAHEVKTARKAFLRIASFFENERQYPELAALVKEVRKTNGQEAVLLTNGGGVEFIARSRGSGRGFTVDVLVCDEAQDLTDDELAALLPTISAAPLGNPQVILTGTPPDPSRPGHGEVFRRVRADGEGKRDPRLSWTDFGAADGPLPDVDNRELWAWHNPAVQPGRLGVAEIERERGLMSAEKFAAERFGWWGDPERAVGMAFGPGAWENCAVEDPGPHVTALGIAVSVDRAWSSLGAAGGWGDRLLVAAVERRQGTGWLVPEVKRIQGERGCPVVIHGAGPASDLIPALEAAGVKLTIAKTGDALDACAQIFDGVQEARIAHPDHPELNTAVGGAHKRSVGERWAWDRRNSASDVSMLEAVTLAAWKAAEAEKPNREFWGAIA